MDPSEAESSAGPAKSEMGLAPQNAREQPYAIGLVASVKNLAFSVFALTTKLKLKRIDASFHVLATYHDSFLYGKIPLTVRVRTALRTGVVGYLWHMVEFILAVLSGVLYVYSTYNPNVRIKWVTTCQSFASVAFVVDYVLRVYSEPVRLSYVVSMKGLIDLLSALPVIFVVRDQLQLNEGGSVIRLLQFLRIVRIFSLVANLGIVGSSVAQQIVLLTVSTFGVIFLDAGLLQWVEYNGRKNECPPRGCMDFWNAFYFLIVTISTVGYGDVTPKTQIGQCIAVMTILVALVILPIQIGKITSLASRRPFGGAFGGLLDSQFLIISGSISFRVIEEFLAEIYNCTHSEDLDSYPIRVVILAPFSPSFDLKQILSLYHGQVTFIEGSPVIESDLERVRASKASAFFLLADRQTEDPAEEDAAQIVRALAVHRFCGGQVRIILEVIEPETQASAVWDETQTGSIEVICPAKLHYKMLARNCFVKGLYTFIVNAFTSELRLKKFPDGHFMSEYFHSYDNEFYPVILPAAFSNRLYEEVAEFLFISFNVVLFALDVSTTEEATGRTVRRVLLHPKGHIIQPDDVGLCICWNLRTAYMISNFKYEDYQQDPLPQRLKRNKSTARERELEVFSSVSKKWRERGSVAGLTRESWMGSDENGSVRWSKRVESPEGHHALKSHLRSAIHNVIQEGKLEKGMSSSASVHDRAGSGDDEDWEQAFSRGGMNDLDGRYPQGKNLEKATEELLAWPPLLQYGRPRPSVLERHKGTILSHLEAHTLPIVSLDCAHLLVCCQRSWPSNIYYFLAELRKPGFPNPPVVIMYAGQPTATQWGSVGVFNEVYFVRGSPIYELDLMRGGVLQAEKVVVLADQGSISDDKESDDNDNQLKRKRIAVYTSDVDNIIILANIERLMKSKVEQVTVEMQHTLGFYYLKPQYVMPRSMVSNEDYRRNRDALVHFTPPYMAGKVVSPSLLGFLLRSSFYNKHTGSIADQLVEGGFVEDADGVSSERLRVLEQIPVPPQYADRMYSDLFLDLLCDRGMLALGLYRAAGSLGAPSPYVFTNPPKETIVNRADLVYVLV